MLDPETSLELARLPVAGVPSFVEETAALEAGQANIVAELEAVSKTGLLETMHSGINAIQTAAYNTVHSTRVATAAAVASGIVTGLFAPAIAKGDETPATTPTAATEVQPASVGDDPEPTTPATTPTPVPQEPAPVETTPAPAVASASSAQPEQPSTTIQGSQQNVLIQDTGFVDTANYPFKTLDQIKTDYKRFLNLYPNATVQLDFKSFLSNMMSACDPLNSVTDVSYQRVKGSQSAVNVARSSFATNYVYPAVRDSNPGQPDNKAKVNYAIPCSAIFQPSISIENWNIVKERGARFWKKAGGKAIKLSQFTPAIRLATSPSSPNDIPVKTHQETVKVKQASGKNLAITSKILFKPGMNYEGYGHLGSTNTYIFSALKSAGQSKKIIIKNGKIKRGALAGSVTYVLK